MVFNLTLSPRIVLSVCVLLASLALFTLCFDLWQWQRDWTLAHTSSNQSVNMNATNKAADLVAALPNEHIFGKTVDDNGNMPITNLQLTITGIVKVPDEQQGNTYSKAYISIANQPSKIYQVGDNLPYGVKVYDITADAVILENGGHLEKLPLTREKLQFKPQNKEDLL